MNTKQCRKCKEAKDLTEFYDHNTNKDGKQSDCKTCLSAHGKSYRERTDYYPKWHKRKQSENPNYSRDRKRQQRKTNPKKHRNTYLLHKYKITLDQYNKILEEQDNRCKICEISQDDTKNLFHVDHCHKTDKIRGLLCLKCNQLLGRAHDKIEDINSMINLLNKAIQYLKKAA